MFKWEVSLTMEFVTEYPQHFKSSRVVTINDDIRRLFEPGAHLVDGEMECYVVGVDANSWEYPVL